MKWPFLISDATFPVRFSISICTVLVRPLTEAWTNVFVFSNSVFFFFLVLIFFMLSFRSMRANVP